MRRFSPVFAGYVFVLLFQNEQFLYQSAFCGSGDDVINACCTVLHVILYDASLCIVEYVHLVYEKAFHIVHSDAYLASHVVEVKVHLSIVGIGHDAEVGLFGVQLFYVEKGGFEVKRGGHSVTA